MSKAKRINDQPVVKGEKMGLLYLFLVPMFISVVISLFSSDYSGFILSGIGFLMLLGSVNLASRGFAQSIEYKRSILAKAPKTPYKTLAALGLGATSFYLSFFAGGEGIFASIFVAILTPVGFYLYYGFDPKTDKLGSLEGVSAQMVLDAIEEAKEKLVKLRDDMDNITDTTLLEKLSVAAQKAEVILQTIEEDPKDVRTARKFLIVYIDGVLKVTNSYTAMDESDIKQETKSRLYALLSDVDSKFNRELERLKQNNQFDLDVHIDVLKEQIKH
jgi:5-bromo-4-chloroindolyl phosphate hydrolysis protein